MSFVLSGHRENLGGPTGEQRGISHWNQVSSASSRILAPRSDGAACTGRINGAVQSEKKKRKINSRFDAHSHNFIDGRGGILIFCGPLKY